MPVVDGIKCSVDHKVVLVTGKVAALCWSGCHPAPGTWTGTFAVSLPPFRGSHRLVVLTCLPTTAAPSRLDQGWTERHRPPPEGHAPGAAQSLLLTAGARTWPEHATWRSGPPGG